METFEIHYWDKDGEAQVATIEGEYGHDAAESIEDMGRLGYIKSLGSVDDESMTEPEDADDESEEESEDDDASSDEDE